MVIIKSVATTLSFDPSFAIFPSPVMSKNHATHWPVTKQTKVLIWLDGFFQVFFIDVEIGADAYENQIIYKLVAYD